MKLPVVDEKGKVIGSETREIIHSRGLLHPEAHMIMRLPNGKFVFQKRSMTKETNPGLLAFAVGGHIEIDETPDQCIIREMAEETGLHETIENLKYLGNCVSASKDVDAKIINNGLKYFYGYDFKGSVDDLQIEENDGAGFEVYSLDEIKNMSPEGREKFTSSLYNPTILAMFEKF